MPEELEAQEVATGSPDERAQPPAQPPRKSRLPVISVLRAGLMLVGFMALCFCAIGALVFAQVVRGPDQDGGHIPTVGSSESSTETVPPIVFPTQADAEDSYGRSIELMGIDYTIGEAKDGWKEAVIAVAMVNTTVRALPPFSITVDKITIETNEGKDYDGLLYFASNESLPGPASVKDRLEDELSPAGTDSQVTSRLLIGAIRNFSALLDDELAEFEASGPYLPPLLPVAMFSWRGASQFLDSSSYVDDGRGYFYFIKFRFAESATPRRAVVFAGTNSYTLDLQAPSASSETVAAPDVASLPIGDLERLISELNPDLSVSFNDCRPPVAGQKGLAHHLGFRAQNSNSLDEERAERQYAIWYTSAVLMGQGSFGDILASVGPGQTVIGAENNLGELVLGYAGGSPQLLVTYGPERTNVAVYRLPCGAE